MSNSMMNKVQRKFKESYYSLTDESLSEEDEAIDLDFEELHCFFPRPAIEDKEVVHRVITHIRKSMKAVEKSASRGSSSMMNKVQRKFEERDYPLTHESLSEILGLVDYFSGNEDGAIDLVLDKKKFMDKKVVQKVITDVQKAMNAVEKSLSSGSSSVMNKVHRKFKEREYSVTLETISEVIGFLTHFSENEDEALNILLDYLDESYPRSAIEDKEAEQKEITRFITRMVKTITTTATESEFIDRTLIDVFDEPREEYDPDNILFHRYTGKSPIDSDASAKATLYKDRFLLFFQRPSLYARHFDSEISGYGRCQISPIQSLAGQTGKKTIMGLISQLEDGHIYLEDLTATVEIDLSNARITRRLFTENTIVVAEGEMLLDGTFQVKTCAFPPIEDQGWLGTPCSQFQLKAREVHEKLVILSDVWLDNEETMVKLQTILTGYEKEDMVPLPFVFMGNFCSPSCNSPIPRSSIRSNFWKLGKMIAAHERLNKHSIFLVILGPDDIEPSDALPRRALPSDITEELQALVPNARSHSNPCRFNFLAGDICFFHQDMLDRIRSSCLMGPSIDETSDHFEHFVATIIHQSHLCPLPLSVQPIIWDFDHYLHIYPTPETIVLADRSEQKAFKYLGTTCFNPGSFCKDFAFAAYTPSLEDVELSVCTPRD